MFIQFLFFQNNTISLAFKRTGIENLVTTACICRKRNQKIRFVKCKKFADCISSCTGYYDICQCKEILELIFDIFKLSVSIQILQRVINLSFAAEVYDLKILQKLWKDAADSFIDCNRTKTSANDHDHRLVRSEA